MIEPRSDSWGLDQKTWAGNSYGYWYMPGRVQEAGGGSDNAGPERYYNYADIAPAPHGFPAPAGVALPVIPGNPTPAPVIAASIVTANALEQNSLVPLLLIGLLAMFLLKH